MKSITNISDRIIIYSIEAARFSYKMMESSFNDLQKLLSTIEDDTLTNDISLYVFKYAWQFIDMSFRFGRMLAQIRGLKHKEVGFKGVEKALVNIEKARNYIQHLNSQIPEVSKEIYPILGAVSWASKDKQKSFTVALGAMPTGTSFHSLSFDTMSKEFMGDIILNIDTFSVNLTECNKLMCSGFEYLIDWIDTNGYSSTKDIEPNIAIVPALNFDAPSKRYLRVQFDFNKGQKK
jgi:hypothetical protein